jgi:uncharacterized phage protein gp47/JayE
MTWGVTPEGFVTETQAENREYIVGLFQSAFGLQIEVAPDTIGGQLVDIMAEMRAAAQQEGLQTYNSYDRATTTGIALDRIGKLIGIPRDGATRSSSEGTITGTGGTVIPDLSRVRLNETNTVWEITGGPYVIPGVGPGQTLANVPLQSQDTGPITAIATSDWTIVDVVVGWDTWITTETATPGQSQQSDKAYRQSQDIGLYARGQGPLLAMSANVDVVEGVVTARTFHNPNTVPVDANGIPYKNTNVVVETDPAIPGADLRQAIATAIWNSSSLGSQTYGAENEIITDSEGQSQSIFFDLVSNVNIYMLITLTTSDEDEAITPNIADVVREYVAEQANEQYTGIGRNTREYEISALVHESGVTGVESVTVQLSTVSTAGPYLSPEVPISIRQRADFDDSVTRTLVTVV